MSVIILLISISIVVALGFLAIFIWAVRSGQFDDTESPGIRILFDDKKKNNTKSIRENDSNPSP